MAAPTTRPRALAARFEAYADWRRRLTAEVASLYAWLGDQGLADAHAEQRVRQIEARLTHDRLVVAFVAEFSRGKSELINALFFADFGQRLLPSAAGRTTMCPTELLHDPATPPSIRLLPIETRAGHASVATLKDSPAEWVTLPLDLTSPQHMGDALARVSQVKRVPLEAAHRLGLHDDGGDVMAALTVDAAASTIEIPCWRHAIVNVPHPLLQQGLVILDTPGLNAIGTEPELTLSLLPQAHAVMFVVAADAGVTRTDLDVWNRYLSGDEVPASGRFVILNKIDGLWDALRSPREVDAEIARQVEASASTLGVPVSQVYPVSAQKALLAKIQGDDALLAKSRVPVLEAALSHSLVPAKKAIVGATVQADVRALADAAAAALSTRARSVDGQLSELCALRGKNREVVAHMLDRARDEKARFERGLARYTALRNVFTAQTGTLLEHVGLDSLRRNAARTRRAIEASPFTKGMRVAMNAFFAAIDEDLAQAGRVAGEMHEMMQAMYARFATESGRDSYAPPPFSIVKYQKEVDRLQRAYERHFNTLWNMVSKAKFALMRRFFETIASRARHVYDIANRDVEAWLRAVMSPLEAQVREHHVELRRRLESIGRVHRASDELEERIAELEQQASAIAAAHRALGHHVGQIDGMIDEDDPLPLAANG